MNKKRFLQKVNVILTLSLFVLVSVSSQATSNTFSLIPSWEKGDSFAIRFTNIDQQSYNGEIFEFDSVSQLAALKVLEKMDSGYRFALSFQMPVEAYDFPERLYGHFDKFSDINIIYLVNSEGEYINIENWDTLSWELTGAYRKAEKLLIQESPDDSLLIKNIYDIIVAKLSTREGIEEKFSIIKNIHRPYGQVFSNEEGKESEIIATDVFPDIQLSGIANIKLTTVGADQNRMSIEQVIKYDQTQTKEFLSKEMVHQIPEETLKTLEFELLDSNNIEYFLNPAKPIKFIYKRTTHMKNGEMNFEISEIRQVEYLN